MARAMSYCPRRYSNDNDERERMPPCAKKSCSEGRRSPDSSGDGRVVIGVVMDKAKKWQSSLVSIIDTVVAAFAKWPFWNNLAAERLQEKAGPFGGSER